MWGLGLSLGKVRSAACRAVLEPGILGRHISYRWHQWSSGVVGLLSCDHKVSLAIGVLRGHGDVQPPHTL